MKSIVTIPAAGTLLALLIALSVIPAFGEADAALPTSIPDAPAQGPAPTIATIDYTVISYPVTGTGTLRMIMNVKASLSPGIDVGKDVASASLEHRDDIWKFPQPATGVLPLFGSGQGASVSNLDREAGAILPLGRYTLTVRLTNGTQLSRDFDVLPPGEVPATNIEYLYTASYRDLVSPWQTEALAAPRVLSAHFGDKTITIKFTIRDPRCANVFFEFGSGTKLVFRSNRVVDPSTGAGRGWFNRGKALLTDGSVNVVVFDRKTLRTIGDLKLEDTTGVQAIATDGLRYRGSSTPEAFKHESISIACPPDPPLAAAATALTAKPALSLGTSLSSAGADGSTVAEAVEPMAPAPSPLPGLGQDDRPYFNWLTGLSAILSLSNGQSSIGLSAIPPPPDYVRDVTELLRGSWGVASREELIAAIDAVIAHGNNASWQSYLRAIRDNPGLSDTELLAKIEGRALQFRLDFVRAHLNSPGGTDILAWDLGRAAMLVRWGFACGYLGPDEAWSRLEDIGRRASEAFHSWEDFGLNYEMGRIFWNGEEMDEGIKLFEGAQEAFVRLLAKGGEWSKTAWPREKE
ncbi:MAG TPA: DUF1266 domain-containing protein [Rectinemataceae bacterium]|nr:DUF1266 domain-containing protein [Rectinemataceae bacterium]